MALRDSTRLAGFFLLAASSMQSLVWAVQRPWGFAPSWIAVVEAVLQAGLGVCLLRIGQRAVSAALAFVLVAFALPVVRVGVSLYNGHPMAQLGLPGVAAMVGGPLFFGAVRALPVFLLLAAAPTPSRRKVAAIAFVVWMLLYVSAHGLTMYSLQYAASR